MSRNIIIKLFLFSLIIGAVPQYGICANKETSDAKVKDVITNFCTAEFNGERDARFNYAKYSQNYKKNCKQIGTGDDEPSCKGIISLTGDLLYIVDSFIIKNVSIKGNSATATVDFDRLAYTEGLGFDARKIIPDIKGSDIVQYNLKKIKGRWWIYDPPLPRVSLKAIINEYEVYLQIHSKKKQDITDSQKSYFNKIEENLNILKSLSSDQSNQTK
jgi:hypothetical protein